jgi:hypothetical protein
MMAPGEDFDQTGFELPRAPKALAEATGQGQLFDDDCSQSDATDREPVFWIGGAEQSGPTSFRPMRWSQFEDSLVDSERAEDCLFTS